jgi:hypothetical protein
MSNKNWVTHDVDLIYENAQYFCSLLEVHSSFVFYHMSAYVSVIFLNLVSDRYPLLDSLILLIYVLHFFYYFMVLDEIIVEDRYQFFWTAISISVF